MCNSLLFHSFTAANIKTITWQLQLEKEYDQKLDNRLFQVQVTQCWAQNIAKQQRAKILSPF